MDKSILGGGINLHRMGIEDLTLLVPCSSCCVCYKFHAIFDKAASIKEKILLTTTH
jgi:hypothetical protein